MLEHVAIWTKNLEELKDFYCSYFGGEAGGKFTCDIPGFPEFESYFISFGDGSRLELMKKAGLPDSAYEPGGEAVGLTHLAFSAKEPTEVDELTARAREEGRTIVTEPYRTLDGYYESCILDPDGNRVEITVSL